MPLTPHCQAVLLLNLSFGRAIDQVERPLSTVEWARFAKWLRDHEIDPAQLLSEDLSALLSHWNHPKISLSRLERLLGRGMALGIAVERWERAGLWVLTRSHPEYPARLKIKLDIGSPAVLIGCGNKKLLDQGGVAVVGSRNVHEDGLTYTRTLAKAVSEHGKSIISGGARGVDRTAMEATLEADGTCVGVLADSLMKTSTSARFRKYIKENSMVLVTPFNPEAGFNVGNAMARNRYIYCLSDCAVVIDSTREKGGTWTGATENLKRGWVPVFAKQSEDKDSGNTALLRLGASQATLNVQELYRVVTEHNNTRSISEVKNERNLASELFECFVSITKSLLVDRELEAKEVASELHLAKGQVTNWLKRAAKEGHITRQKKPVRFTVKKLPLLDETNELKAEIEHAQSISEVENAWGSASELYECFVSLITSLLTDKGLKADEVADQLCLAKGQAQVWLRRATKEGYIVKQTRFRNNPPLSQSRLCNGDKKEARLDARKSRKVGKDSDNTQSYPDIKNLKSPSTELFQSFVSIVKLVLRDNELKADEVADQLCLAKGQTQIWLNKATAEGHIVKQIRFGNLPQPN